jgi:hypothetical protein
VVTGQLVGLLDIQAVQCGAPMWCLEGASSGVCMRPIEGTCHDLVLGELLWTRHPIMPTQGAKRSNAGVVPQAVTRVNTWF